MSRRFQIIQREPVFQGFFRVDRYTLRHALFEGGMSGEFHREVFERGHSAGVLLYDPERDLVVLTEQFRVGAVDAPLGPWLLEVVAGMIEPGESAEDVARREAQEEAGCTVQELIPLFDYLVSPGGTSERTALFVGRVDAKGVGGVYGLPEEDEDIQVHVLPLDEALAMIESGGINAAMPILALQWLALNRDRVRRQWGAAEADATEALFGQPLDP
ncbi:ADP-ribose diphosphatase [Alkalilimnicola sp. S0819]|uniref:ADP-ribose diphosphatase n=1 Tax=Alkalilimnicola sp. S0819 TaxID=2613922 RepID=UPI0012620B32|nr:ADP-ribose diphosphatase [Alkalilimnicola sp. S0819]KAB7627568.1 ADP-ribose diphosphatase [Alkalilimnicola sp. S0819]MPQ15725.1 ADP-ribose diphosphatase [Alkalilimnicola sp. S0819]